jgi:hypothetical protein
MSTKLAIGSSVGVAVNAPAPLAAVTKAATKMNRIAETRTEPWLEILIIEEAQRLNIRRPERTVKREVLIAVFKWSRKRAKTREPIPFGHAAQVRRVYANSTYALPVRSVNCSKNTYTVL